MARFIDGYVLLLLSGGQKFVAASVPDVCLFPDL